jgi:glutaredoxin
MNVVVAQSCHNHHRASLAGAHASSGRSGEKNASSRLRPSSKKSSSSPWKGRGRYARERGVLEERGDAQRLSVVAEPSPVMDDEYNDETKNEEEIEEEEQGCAIAIVGTGACPHCKRAKSALDKLGVKHFDVDVDAFEREESGERILKLSKSISKMRSVPQIYVNGEIIGGADELMIALEDGSLMEKIRDEKTMEKSASALPEIIVRELLKEKMCKENALGVEECEIHTDVNRREEEEEEERIGKTDATVTTTTKQSDIKFTDEIPYEGLVHIINMARKDPETEGGLKLVETKRKTIIPFCPQKYPRTFSAERFIQWLLMKDICADRKAALDVGEMMVQEELMHSIDRTDAFTSANIDPVKFGVNGYQKGIFRFQKDEVEVGVAGLNSEFIFRGEARDATTVANDLRKRILDLYGSFLNADGTRVDYEGMKESEKFEEYKTVAAELQRCDPRLLNRNDRMAFFINVYNALIVHATIVKGVPDNALKRLKFFDEAKYDIGGLQYSANDIEHGVLRSNRPSPAAIGVLLGKPELSRGPFKNGDARRECCITPMDPRIHFALVCGAKSCPPIRVFKGEEIDEQLEDATFAFIEGDVEVDYRCSFIVNRASGKSTDVEKPCIVDEIRASKIIAEWYKTDFGKSNWERIQFITKYLKEDEAKEALTYVLSRAHGKTGAGEKTIAVLKAKPYDWTSNGVKSSATRPSGPDFNAVKSVYNKNARREGSVDLGKR